MLTESIQKRTCVSGVGLILGIHIRRSAESRCGGFKFLCAFLSDSKVVYDERLIFGLISSLGEHQNRLVPVLVLDVNIAKVIVGLVRCLINNDQFVVSQERLVHLACQEIRIAKVIQHFGVLSVSSVCSFKRSQGLLWLSVFQMEETEPAIC